MEIPERGHRAMGLVARPPPRHSIPCKDHGREQPGGRAAERTPAGTYGGRATLWGAYRAACGSLVIGYHTGHVVSAAIAFDQWGSVGVLSGVQGAGVSFLLNNWKTFLFLLLNLLSPRKCISGLTCKGF